MRVCLFGNKGTTTALIDHLQAAGCTIDTLVTLNRAAQARVEISGADAALASVAERHGIKVFAAEKYSLSTAQDQAFFAESRFDLGLCTGWQRLIPDSVLSTFGHGVFGWHGSGFRFPNGRGRSPLNWSLRLGLETVYHNCFRYAPGVDDGQIYETEVLPIAQTDYIADLQAKALSHIKASAVRLLQDAATGTVPLTEQIDHPFITFPALNEAAGFLSLQLLTCREALDITRSCSHPFPGAFVRIADTQDKVRIWRLSEAPGRETGQAGQIIHTEDGVLLHFKDGVLFCTEPAFADPATAQRLRQEGHLPGA